MTRGAWMCRQQDDGLKIWFAPRENEKPFTESERAQRWRLSLASLLFITVLLSDHLWFCAEAKLTRTRDKRQDKQLAFTDMAEYLNSTHHHHIPSSDSHSPHSRLTREPDVIFIGNSTKPLWRLDICHPDSLSKDCFTFTDAEPVCLGLSRGVEDGTHGFTSPDNINCSLDVAEGDTLGCSKCVHAYQRFDRQAQEDYQEFELLVEKYETDEYSVRTYVWSAGCVLAELLLGQPIFPGDSGVDQLVEIIKVLGTPTREQIREMNPNYTEFKFPQIKAHPWTKVFRPRTPPEAIALCSRLLEYTPTSRLTPLEACAHSFFDELRDPNVKLPNGREKPSLFNFTTQELSSNPSLANILIPAHARTQAASSTPTNATVATDGNSTDHGPSTTIASASASNSTS
ncbi:unnamed protein product [Coregonus sp. 'balchen']|nr:unnamed protein product [Coregonus sp. 'balchen']